MTVIRRFTLDTNILVYAADQEATEKREHSINIIRLASNSDCVLTVQVLAEFFYATTQKKLLDRVHARKFVEKMSKIFETVATTDSVFTEAIETTINHRLSFWDATILAAASQSGCSLLLSEDMQDGQRLNGVEILNPYAQNASERLDFLFNE